MPVQNLEYNSYFQHFSVVDMIEQFLMSCQFKDFSLLEHVLEFSILLYFLLLLFAFLVLTMHLFCFAFIFQGGGKQRRRRKPRSVWIRKWLSDKRKHRIEGRIEKKDTWYRKSLPPGLKLSITLRQLAFGDSYPILSYNFRVPPNTISLIVNEVCDAI